jgi:hypothetical protein
LAFFASLRFNIAFTLQDVTHTATIAAAALCATGSANFPCTRRNSPFRRSSANFSHSRRFCANAVALPVFAAIHSATKVALQRHSPCFPPRPSATILPFSSPQYRASALRFFLLSFVFTFYFPLFTFNSNTYPAGRSKTTPYRPLSGCFDTIESTPPVYPPPATAPPRIPPGAVPP